MEENEYNLQKILNNNQSETEILKSSESSEESDSLNENINEDLSSLSNRN